MTASQPPREGLGQRIVELLGTLRQYVGLGGASRREPLETPESLRRFLETRASHVAQTSLYGYLRTRAGTRFSELFDDEDFVISVNIAKWQIWLDCLSDLAVYSGALLQQRSDATHEQISGFVEGLVESIIEDAHWPHEAGPTFPDHSESVLLRIRNSRWASIGDDETAFSQSPQSLVTWTPIIDELKQLDADIVRNSVRFRWQEIRRDLRDALDAESIIGAMGPNRGGPNRGGT